MSTAPTSLRLEELRRRAAAAIPCWPDDEATRAKLEALPLPDLLVAYVNYADRIVPARRRKVLFASNFWDDRAKAHAKSLSVIEAKIRSGEDLTPHLSELVRTHGFVARPQGRRAKARKGPAWSDKDFALNAYETHHLHLGTKLRADGLIERTDDLLYAGFPRDAVVMLMVGDHKSFDDGSLSAAVARWRAANCHGLRGAKPSAIRTFDEERRLARTGISTLMSVDDQVLIQANVSSSGHRALGVLHAMKIARVLKDVDPRLDEPGYVASMWGENASSLPERPHFNWYLDYVDLLLVEEISKTAVRLVSGYR